MDDLLDELQRLGIRLQLDGDDLRISARAGALDERLRQALRQHKPALVRSLRASQAGPATAVTLEHDAAARFEPFALTELQHAYWLGRDTALDMGSVATHLYVELSCQDLDLPRAQRALRELIDRHDMLRAVVDGQGGQRVLAQVPAYEILSADCQHDPDAAQQAVQATRDALSHQVLDAHRWPLFDVRATHLPGGELRLHVSLDLLILDAWSIFLFFREWHAIYRNPAAGVRPRIGYRDYVLAERRQREDAAYAAAQAYWESRIDALPLAPALPLRSDPSARAAPRFVRREARLDAARWSRLKHSARERGLTPSGVVLGAYAEVLARWSETAHFTLNVTTGSRQPWHADVHQLLGDFTSLVLHEVDRRDTGQSFASFANSQQKRLLQDLDHAAYSGLTVRREWARRRGLTLKAALPVVFSSGLVWSGDDEVGNLEQFGKKVYSISQTSQVWLDHHVMELGGELVLIWDAVDAVFEPGVLDALFESYTTLINRLADDAAVWDASDVAALPVAMQARRDAANATAAPLATEALHAAVVMKALTQPDVPAIITPQRTLSFGAWLARACAVADRLLDAGVQPGEPVAVLTRKGWEQPVAVLGALLAGAAYVPIDADLPPRRQAELLALCGSRFVLTQQGWRPDRAGPVEGGVPMQVLCVDAEAPAETLAPYGQRHARSLLGARERLAYVIFTSGTTGVPKGVMVEHGAAVNTVLAVNRRFGVGPGDRVLGVSSLSFDLSVYDLFGVPGAGGALVLPDARRQLDAAHWLGCLREHGVTVWNSAPQLMRMLTDTLHAEPAAWGALASLRTVLLSGDFIPLDLPARLREHGCVGAITSLGGATEASIWSIWRSVEAVDPAWASIPYGRAMPNQSMWVLDAALRPVPDAVRGRIYIGGHGLARGYLGDEAKTAQRFITHPRSGERLYDTGDLGRFNHDGDIVILGRDDGQVKIRGHRVELGEIESVLCRQPGIGQAVVLARAGVVGHPSLVAYVVPLQVEAPPAAPERPALQEDALQQALSERLPEYMVPRHFVVLDSLPLSANGKLDHAALPAWLPGAQGAAAAVAPRDETEAAVLAVWARVIPGLDIGMTDNFFDLGGDSVLATQLLRELNASLPCTLEMHELFENLTIESLATLVRSRIRSPDTRDQPGFVPTEPTHGLASPESLSSDVEAGRAGIREQLAHVAGVAVASGPEDTVLLTGATGWVGVHVLAALLTKTRQQVVCLVRGEHEAAARQRLLALLQQRCGVDGAALARVRVVCGDVTHPRLGLQPTAWAALCMQVGAVFHLAANVGVMHDYASHRASNVQPLHQLLELAISGPRKRLVVLSPMAVCRRWLADEGGLVVEPEERVGSSPRGLLTAYAQSKWVAEQLLWAAAEAGLAVRLYRCSHALPSAGRAQVKTHDTYATVLELARRVPAVPDWPRALVLGLPVDCLAELMVQDAFSSPARGASAVVHLEQRNPTGLCELIRTLQPVQHPQGAAACPTVPAAQWRQLCLEAIPSLPPAQQVLASGLLELRAGRMAVENMFTEHTFDTHALSATLGTAAMAGLTPARYWTRAFAAVNEPGGIGGAAEGARQAQGMQA